MQDNSSKDENSTDLSPPVIDGAQLSSLIKSINKEPKMTLKKSRTMIDDTEEITTVQLIMESGVISSLLKYVTKKGVSQVNRLRIFFEVS
jgi:hypothetical protein